MGFHKLTNLILSIVEKTKPILVRIFPIEFLRNSKRKMILSSLKKMDTNEIIAFDKKKNSKGVNLIGFIRAEIGLGQSCRLVARELENSDYNFSVYNYQQVSIMRHNDTSWEHKISDHLKYNINLIHINPYELPIAFINMGKQSWNYRYNIGFWLWELETFPTSWLPALDLVDEIWAPSEFSLIAIRKITNKPTFVLPYAIDAPTDKKFNRNYFNLPEDKFLFLSMYDSNSTIERKNPIATINAYKKAFPKEDPNVGIIIKINNPQPEDIATIEEHLKGYKNIYLIKSILSKVEVNSLLMIADVFVSLHRAEGFGLPIAEAMFLGTPAIATNWSSNTEFMTEDCSCLVNFKFVEIKKDVGPYEIGNRWADPITDHAAAFMLKLFTNKKYYTDIATRGKKHVHNILNLEQATNKLNQRLSQVYERN